MTTQQYQQYQQRATIKVMLDDGRLQAWLDGATLQLRWDNNAPWEDLEIVGFAKTPDHYRIKPARSVRPWTFEEARVNVGAIIMRPTALAGKRTLITAVAKNCVVEDSCWVYLGTGAKCSSGDVMNNYQFPDGRPCGVEVEG